MNLVTSSPADVTLAADLFDGLPFTRRMAVGSGLSRERLELLLHTGVVRRVLRDVYVDARSPDDTPSRAAAVALVLPEGAAIGRRTAAWLLGVDAWPLGEHQANHPVECVVPRGTEPVRRPGILPALHLRHNCLRIDQLRVGQCVGAGQAEVRRAGVTKGRYLARLIEPATESPGESMVRLRITDAGLPRPQVQIEILDDDGRLVWRLDLGWKAQRKAVEYDGERHHSSPDEIRRDIARREDLRARGWQVYVARKEHVLGRGMELEWAVAAMLGTQPTINRRRW